MSDVTSLLIGWMHDGANCLPTDADIGSGYIGTSTAIHTLSVSNSSPAYVFEACGLDVSRTYFLGGYVNNLEAGGFFIDPEYLLGTPSSSASRLFLIVYGYSADTASGLPTAEDVVVDELIDDVSVIVGLIRVK
ncbi:MAG: hypothetical protein GX638_19150 [Crenarchaeota archaeon]|nr:hypothetical protein [Thermoproteota archaeon]